MTYIPYGKQVLRDGKDVAQASSVAYATAIAAALNATSTDKPVMRELLDAGVEVPSYGLYDDAPNPAHAPDALRTIRADDGRFDIYRGSFRLGYLTDDDALWLIDTTDGFAYDTGERIDKTDIASAMSRYRR